MNIIRTAAIATLSAGAVSAAALGLAGTASAQTAAPTGPGYSYSPQVKAQPAPNAQPGHRWHVGAHHLAVLVPTATNGEPTRPPSTGRPSPAA
jgi:hypothetical protein